PSSPWLVVSGGMRSGMRIPRKRRHMVRWGLGSPAGLIILGGAAASAHPETARTPLRTVPGTATPIPTSIPTAIPTSTPVPLARPTLQTGMVFPRWVPDSYGPRDTGWTTGLQDVQRQTGARWVELVFTLYQDNIGSTQVHRGPFSFTPQAVAAGAASAHSLGFKVFVVPHLIFGRGGWGGLVRIGTREHERAWFDSYWVALKPYLQVSAQVHAEQFALGNEYVGLESAPARLWATLIARARGVYSGGLTYNVNHDSLVNRAWMHDPRLTYLGVSMYRSLLPGPTRVTLAQLERVWQRDVLPLLDRFSADTGKPLLLSEIGYKNSRDTLFNPWQHTTSAPRDPQLQAHAYEAAVRAVFGDHHIEGIYFWAWSNDRFAPNGQPAA